MRKINLLIFFLSWVAGACAYAQTSSKIYVIIIKGGHVTDPKNKIDSKMDVAITNGNIFQVASDIASAKAKKVVDARGLCVTPGLIDIHVHAFAGTSLKQLYKLETELPIRAGGI